MKTLKLILLTVCMSFSISCATDKKGNRTEEEGDSIVDETKEVNDIKRQDKAKRDTIASQDYAGDVNGSITMDQLKEGQQADGVQADENEEALDNQHVEVQVKYPGGEAALLKFISNNLVYPSIAQEQELQGTVVLRFRVEKDGNVGRIVVKKSLSKECDQAAIDVVKRLRRFTPARQHGKPVAVWFTLPIQFRIIE